MTPKQKKQWVKALTSGKYRQGKVHLYKKSANRFCCLGVYLKEVEKVPTKELNLTGLPCQLEGRRAITKKQARFIPGVIQTKLAYMNDKGMPFDMIAGFIHYNVDATEQ